MLSWVLLELLAAGRQRGKMGRLVRKIQKYWIADVLLFLLFWVCVYVMATSAGSPFLYFQF